MKKRILILCSSFLILLLTVVYAYYFNTEDKSLSAFSSIKKGLFRKQNIDSDLSLQKVFSKDHSWNKTLPEDKKIVMIATGDIIPARTVNFKTVTANNFNWPYEKTADVLRSADLTFVNLESPLIDNCPLTNEGMVFCGDKRNVQGLLFAGVDVANLANNHIYNHGQEGVDSTVNLLLSSEILPSGSGSPAYKGVKNMRFGFLGYNVLDGANEKKIEEDIKEARKNADIVAVAFHWGEEYTSQPNKVQRELAHLSIDSGADLIIGNHPHWIQPVEIYKDKLIVYAHGNFVFDQMWSEETKKGVIGKYTFFDKKLIDAEFLPVKIESYGQPYFLEDKEKEDILKSLFKDSQNIQQ